MGAQFLPVNSLTPASVANDLMGTIKSIERAIENSQNKIQEVEGRGFFKSAFSSSSSDLVGISKSQNEINDLMLGMIQEIITLNVMSYSFLASVLDEFQKNTNLGWRDSEGRLQQLSKTGRTFADTAGSIFNKILEGSKSTQETIELSKRNIFEIKERLIEKDALDQEQSLGLVQIKERLIEKDVLDHEQSLRLDQIRESLTKKDTIDQVQSRKINNIVEDIQNSHLNNMQQDALLDLQKKSLDTLHEDLLFLRNKIGENASSLMKVKRYLLALSIFSITPIIILSLIYFGLVSVRV